MLREVMQRQEMNTRAGAVIRQGANYFRGGIDEQGVGWSGGFGKSRKQESVGEEGQFIHCLILH
jgi:hypothetical protein